MRAVQSGGGPTYAVGPYLRQAARSAFVDEVRRQTEQSQAASALERVADLLVEDPLAALDDTDDDVQRAIQRLRPRARQLLFWTVVEERPHAEVGTMTGMTANAVGVAVHRARHALRSAYLELQSTGESADVA